MLPPIEDSVLQSNPKFALLHANLAKNFLNKDGSTKIHPSQKERDRVTEEYRAARLRDSKCGTIKKALCELTVMTTAPISKGASSKSNQPAEGHSLPQEVVDIILLVSAQLTSGPLSPESLGILKATPQRASLSEEIPRIGKLLSAHVHSLAVALTKVQFPTTNPSYVHRSLPKLVPAIQALKEEITAKKHELATRRIALVNKVGMVLGLYHVASTLAILHLEQVVHGSVARHTKARTEYLSIVAEQVALATKEKNAKAEKLVYSDTVRSALEEYMYSLRDSKERLKERKREVERVLWGYGVGREDDSKQRTMSSIADKYDELQRELKEVERDVKRLKGESSI